MKILGISKLVKLVRMIELRFRNIWVCLNNEFKLIKLNFICVKGSFRYKSI